MNIANKITLFRLGLVPLFFLVFFSSSPRSLILSMVIFLIAGLSDILDGYLARKYHMVTPIGTVLDPLADKAMVLSVVGSMAYLKWMPSWLFLFLIVKEGIQIGLGTFFYFNQYNIHIPANGYGKGGTAFLYSYIISVGFSFPMFLQQILLFFVFIFGVAAFFSYGKAFFRKVKDERKRRKSLDKERI